MLDDSSFTEFVARIRSGDAEAAAELVRRYEPVIRLEVRIRLTDHRLRRLFDSMDICQSVLSSFFVRAAVGQFELDDPSRLVRLLVAIARNKVANQARQQQSTKRDHRRALSRADEDLVAEDPSPSPSRVIAGRELLDAFRCRLSDEERQVADLRSEGRHWTEVAELLGGTADGRRKQLTRAVVRVTRELDIDH
jgi:RNA polymerase sigma-70 factor (ECF subfamily)